MGEDHGAIRELRRRLQAEGIPPPVVSKRGDAGSGAIWARSTIVRILHEPAYKGEGIAWRRKHFTRNAEQWRDPAEWVRLPAETTPALVSPALWEAAQRVMQTERGQTTRNTERPYLLRGLIQCAICGRAMYPEPEHGRRTYRCSSRESAAGACGGKRVPADAVEAWAWERVRAVLHDPQIVAAELERQRAETPDPLLVGDCDALRKQLDTIERQQARLIQRFSQASDDHFPWELVEREIARAEQEKTRVRAEIEAAEQRIAQHATAIEHLDALATYCARVGRHLDRAGFAEQRLALEALGIALHANGREWHLTGSIPLDGVAGVLTPTCSCQVRLAQVRPCWRGLCRASCRVWAARSDSK
ncbi:MAG TPA: recombinase zinc beta ribbon domain-containing protein [Dehalococcoidia bacterium]